MIDREVQRLVTEQYDRAQNLAARTSRRAGKVGAVVVDEGNGGRERGERGAGERMKSKVRRMRDESRCFHPSCFNVEGVTVEFDQLMEHAHGPR